MTIPYTYVIGWSSIGKFYYGVRFAKGCNPEDLFKTYFTSSKHVKNIIKIKGLPDIIKVRKKFTSIDQARLWENKVLRRLNVVYDEKWINKTNNISISPDACKLSNTPESRIKKSKDHIGKKHSEETKLKIKKQTLVKIDFG